MQEIVYKVLSASEWQSASASGTYHGSADDLRDGFIHFSAAHQLDGTLQKYFRQRHDLVLVAFRASALGPELKFEASRGGDLFPHLYGPLPTALALWQRPLELHDDKIPDIKRK